MKCVPWVVGWDAGWCKISYTCGWCLFAIRRHRFCHIALKARGKEWKKLPPALASLYKKGFSLWYYLCIPICCCFFHTKCLCECVPIWEYRTCIKPIVNVYHWNGILRFPLPPHPVSSSLSLSYLVAIWFFFIVFFLSIDSTWQQEQ